MIFVVNAKPKVKDMEVNIEAQFVSNWDPDNVCIFSYYSF